MTRVTFFGAYDPLYPRNRILREGLLRLGVEVVEARVPERRVWRRWPALALAFSRATRRRPRPAPFGPASARESPADEVVLVPEFRHKDVPLARALAFGRRLVFDPLVSRWDTLVLDWRLHAERSAQARWNRTLDRVAFSLADLVLCDTWAHGVLFESLGARRERLRRVLVGAEDAFFSVGPPREDGPVRVVYLGGFLPLHGVTVVVEALARLERMELPAFEVSLIGRGIEWERARAQAVSGGLRRVSFPGALDYAQAPAALGAAQIVLGAFGAGEKAGRVVPHKVYQGLAAGRAVVTGDGPGVREVFEPGRHLIAVPRGEAEPLAEALAALIRDAGARRALGEAARARAREVGTPERVAASLIEALRGESAN